jgi:magnesium-transporting ATPase (P-type)
VAESVLTGESQLVDKTVDGLDDADLPLGDRINMLHMNTEIARGRASMVVTATGMNTEIGAIATLLGGRWSQDTTAAPHRSTDATADDRRSRGRPPWCVLTHRRIACGGHHSRRT